MRRTVTLGQTKVGQEATWMPPMIDVLFQMLVYFLCTAGFAEPENLLPTELPKEAPGLIDRKQSIVKTDFVQVVIGVHEEAGKQVLKLNGKPLAVMDDLRRELGRLGKVSPDLDVVLDIGPTVILDRIVAVYDECLAAGLTKVSFSVPKPK